MPLGPLISPDPQNATKRRNRHNSRTGPNSTVSPKDSPNVQPSHIQFFQFFDIFQIFVTECQDLENFKKSKPSASPHLLALFQARILSPSTDLCRLHGPCSLSPPLLRPSGHPPPRSLWRVLFCSRVLLLSAALQPEAIHSSHQQGRKKEAAWYLV